jgi:hypothetical protein
VRGGFSVKIAIFHNMLMGERVKRSKYKLLEVMFCMFLSISLFVKENTMNIYLPLFQEFQNLF